MESQHDSLKSIGKNVEPKEGERRLLCCNKANVRSPSLGFNPNKEFISEDIALDYLASILVEIFLHNKYANSEQKSGNILPCVNKRASR